VQKLDFFVTERFANPAPAVVPLSNEQDDVDRIVQEEGRMFQPRAITSSFAQSDIDDDHAEFDNLVSIIYHCILYYKDLQYIYAKETHTHTNPSF
jgi:hypothetical protein